MVIVVMGLSTLGLGHGVLGGFRGPTGKACALQRESPSPSRFAPLVGSLVG